MTEETVGIDSQAAFLVDELTDDYESWSGDLSNTSRKAKMVM